MKKIKSDILNVSRELFNDHGVANVSVREISRKLNISHSNLIYHFKTKNEIIEALHDQLFDHAVAINAAAMQNKNIFSGMYHTILKGFTVLYEYRFLMIDLNLITRENALLHEKLLAVEKARIQMNNNMIQQLQQHDFMREALFDGEYDLLIERIRIFSDYWIPSSCIYDTGEAKAIIRKYARLFLSVIYPYLTEKGRAAFESHNHENKDEALF